MKRKTILALCVCFAFGACIRAEEIASPDGKLVLAIETVPATANGLTGRLVYKVSFRGKPLVEESGLRFELEGQRPLGPEVRITRTEKSQGEDSYKLLAGKTSEVHDRYNSLRLDLAQDELLTMKFSIEARVFDDAVAFRYVIPDQGAIRSFRLTKESTEFRIAKDATTYALELPNPISAYGRNFCRRSPKSSRPADKPAARASCTASGASFSGNIGTRRNCRTRARWRAPKGQILKLENYGRGRDYRSSSVLAFSRKRASVGSLSPNESIDAGGRDAAHNVPATLTVAAP